MRKSRIVNAQNCSLKRIIECRGRRSGRSKLSGIESAQINVRKHNVGRLQDKRRGDQDGVYGE